MLLLYVPSILKAGAVLAVILAFSLHINELQAFVCFSMHASKLS